MKSSLPFQRKHLACAVGIALSFALTPAQAEISQVGRVLAVRGVVTAAGPGGNTRTLEQGGEIYTGDTIDTQGQGQIQIRFLDGGLVSLRPSTRFEVDEYKEDNPNAKGGGSVVLKLIKGGLRTISGTIGDNAGDKYSLQTQVATIGIRGTQFSLLYCADNSCGTDVAAGLYGSVVEGPVIVGNDGGNGQFGAGSYFLVRNEHSSPQPLLRPPEVLLTDSTNTSGGSGSDKGGSLSGHGLENLVNQFFSDQGFHEPWFSSSQTKGVEETSGEEGGTSITLDNSLLAFAGIDTSSNAAFPPANACLATTTSSCGGERLGANIDWFYTGITGLYAPSGSEGTITNKGTISSTLHPGAWSVTAGTWAGPTLPYNSDGTDYSFAGKALWAYSDNPTTASQFSSFFTGNNSFTYSLSLSGSNFLTDNTLIASDGSNWTVSGLTVDLAVSGGSVYIPSSGVQLDISDGNPLDAITLTNSGSASVTSNGFSASISGNAASAGSANGTLNGGLMGSNAEGMLVGIDLSHSSGAAIEGVKVLEQNLP
jgi:hypothetical protein